MRPNRVRGYPRFPVHNGGHRPDRGGGHHGSGIWRRTRALPGFGPVRSRPRGRFRLGLAAGGVPDPAVSAVLPVGEGVEDGVGDFLGALYREDPAGRVVTGDAEPVVALAPVDSRARSPGAAAELGALFAGRAEQDLAHGADGGQDGSGTGELVLAVADLLLEGVQVGADPV